MPMPRTWGGLATGACIALAACARADRPGPDPALAGASPPGPAAQRRAEPAVATASASVAPAPSASAPSPSASASASAPALRPDGCPAPSETPFPVELGGPLGPARVTSKEPPPRCYPQVIEFGRYTNMRFALAADVPRFLELYGSGSGNGDGATFALDDGLEIRVWGSHNHDIAAQMTEQQSIEKGLAEARAVEPGERLVALARDGNAIIRVSVQNGKRSMMKVVYEDGLKAGVLCTYDEARRAYFEPIEQRLRDSLRTTSGGLYDRPRKPNRRYPRD